MSIRIYCAYRVPTRKINEYVKWARLRLLSAAADRVRKLAAGVPADKIPPPPEGFSGDLVRRDRLKRYQYVFDEVCGVVAKSPYRDPLVDIECGLNIWLTARNAYIVPYGESSLTKVVMDDPPEYADDYSYWNNSSRDEDSDISARDWATRAKVWNRLLYVSNDLRLYHDVVKMTPTGIFDLECELRVWDNW